MSSTAGLIVASILVALLAVFSLYVYFRFLTGYKERKERLKKRQERTKRARRHYDLERDIELGIVGGSDGGVRDPRVERKPVRAEIEFEKGERGRGFVDIPLDDGENGTAGYGGASSASSIGSRERRLKDASPTCCSSQQQQQKQQQQQYHSLRPAARHSRRKQQHHRNHRLKRNGSAVTTTSHHQSSTVWPQPFPMPTLMENKVSNSWLPSPVSPYLPPPKASSSRISKLSNWSYRLDKDGFEQVRAQGTITSSPSTVRPESSVSQRIGRGGSGRRDAASSAVYPAPPPVALIRPASSVYSTPILELR